MLLFLPLRSIDDVKRNGSYLKKWQSAYTKGFFSEEMINIAENIQTIHNSMEATMTENPLDSTTVLEEADDVMDKHNDDSTDQYDKQLLDTVAELFAKTGNACLSEETRVINQSFAGKFFETEDLMPDSTVETTDRNSVISFDNSEPVITSSYDTNLFTTVFQTAVSELNTLAVTQFILISEELHESDQSEVENETINATGSCQSIIEWGKHAKLDAQQQCAFEILSATYVLTFYKNAKDDVNDQLSIQAFKTRKNQLCMLARRDPTSEKPLRMFITGPPGAGKCK